MKHIKTFEEIEPFYKPYEPYFTKKYGVWKGIYYNVVEICYEDKKFLTIKQLYTVKNDKIEDAYYKNEIELQKTLTTTNSLKFQSDDLDECKEIMRILAMQDKFNI
jgi:hypothetical protein